MIINILKWIIFSVIGLVCLFGLSLLYFTLTAYTPDQQLEIPNLSQNMIPEKEAPEELTLLTWNIGYCGIGKKMDSLFEGGKMGVPKHSEDIERNILAVKNAIRGNPADIYFLQEVDQASSRTFDINQKNEIIDVFPGFNAWFANNFKVQFVPSPISDPIGRVDSGILTLSKWNSKDTYRHQLPGDYPWPTWIFHLKRCLTIIKIKSSIDNRDWVMINLHLSAYDAGGTLRKQQLEYVKNLMQKHYNDGNYVIVGGDWNSLFPGVTMNSFGTYTTSEENLFWVQNIEDEWTPDKWQWVFDKKIPTCRSLEKPYTKSENFTTIIDGFIVSPNVEVVTVKGIDLGFENSDHNPVLMNVKLIK